MIIITTTTTTTTPGPRVQINCPACRTLAANAETEDRREVFRLFHLVPLLWKTTTYVRCTKCRHEFVASKRAAELRGMTPTDATRCLDAGPPFMAKFLAITAGVTCLLLILGLLVSIPATIVTWKHPGWTRNLSRIALGISITLTGIGIYGIITGR
ncbi:MAG TPA: hypothetical protein VG734_27400 [Lacunisphaera sp.]|nr:hypothetical protein [Lacunisphaera sp.]